MREVYRNLPPDIMVTALLLMAAITCWLLVKGFLSNRMFSPGSIGSADRRAQPVLFWFNAGFNVFLVAMIAIIVPQIAD